MNRLTMLSLCREGKDEGRKMFFFFFFVLVKIGIEVYKIGLYNDFIFAWYLFVLYLLYIVWIIYTYIFLLGGRREYELRMSDSLLRI